MRKSEPQPARKCTGQAQSSKTPWHRMFQKPSAGREGHWLWADEDRLLAGRDEEGGALGRTRSGLRRGGRLQSGDTGDTGGAGSVHHPETRLQARTPGGRAAPRGPRPMSSISQCAGPCDPVPTNSSVNAWTEGEVA